MEDNNNSSSSEDEDYELPAKKKRKMLNPLIDDAAQESGEESGDDDEDDDDDDGENEYIKDGFIVDEEEDQKKTKKDDLEDSEDEDDEEEDDDDDELDDDDVKRRRRLKKVRKMRQELDDEDLALIQEAQGLPEDDEELLPEVEAPVERQRVVAKTEEELRKGLFHESDEEPQQETQDRIKKIRVERYDEDGMDDFIEDDIGDQADILESERFGGYGDEDDREVNEAQLQEASEIFGTDYLDFMKDEQVDYEEEEELLGKQSFRERGVGVDYGVVSDEEEILSEDEDDLFGDDEVAGLSDQQKAEALRLKREKSKLAKAERRKQAERNKRERRKAQLRRAFEPVQLIENFCTERDDEIRQMDAPERFFGWSTPFHGSVQDGMNEEERAEALWVVGRIPDISSEYSAASDNSEQQYNILLSITNALRFMHRDRLEPAFIKRYRREYVMSPAVLENLYNIMDEDGEWERILASRSKVDSLLVTMNQVASVDESSKVDALKLQSLQGELEQAQGKLDESAKQESLIKSEIAALGDVEYDDDDDHLFGDEDDEKNKNEKDRLGSHLRTLQSLMEVQSERISQLQREVQIAEAQNRALSDPGPMERIALKTCRDLLWNHTDYLMYLSSLTDIRHILDLNSYLNLLKEGDDAIRKKELPLLTNSDTKNDYRRRSRRFDRDFYRTCVSEGLRAVAYRFLLAPNRVGIKLEDAITTGVFDFSKVMPGENNNEGGGDPLKWVAPVIPMATPNEFAHDLIGSGELAILAATHREADINDPLKGCRYVAAIELAQEPRVRRYLRDIYRGVALVTTKPTKRGLDEIDAFHDYYGIHLIRNKLVKQHFPMSTKENEAQKATLPEVVRKEADEAMKKQEHASCIQYLNILKAEQTGHITVHVHLPLREQDDEWYLVSTDRLVNRNNQDLSCLMDEIQKVYLPPDGDSDEWNEQRLQVLRLALMNFLLPQFESELRRDLREAAAKHGVKAACESLKSSASQGPYRPASLLHKENRFIVPTGNLPIVGVSCASDGKDATYLASVTERGESNDFLAIPPGMKVDHPKMREKVITFLLQSRPSAVVVGTSGGFESRLLHRKLNDIVAEAVSRWGNRDIQAEDEDDDAFEARQQVFRQMMPPGHYDDGDEVEWTCNVDLVDDSIAQLFGRSVRGKKEFPDYSVNLKCAISVARYAKDPLAEYTYAYSVASESGVFGTEMLYLNIYNVQQLLPKAYLLKNYERTLCELVADVGADLNACSSFDHLRGILMFVPGLGPRKASMLKQTISQVGLVVKRRDVLEKRMLGPIVYNNAIAFLKISVVDQLDSQLMHPLDGTRLHPDVYLRNNWAAKIAFDALEREDSKSSASAAIKAINDVMKNSEDEVKRLFLATKAEWEQLYGPTFNIKDWDPRIDVPADFWHDKVEELDLNAFANMIEENGHGRWHSHLEMIKWEFRLPFADPRKPMDPLAGDKLFRLITGETDQSLRPGKEVTGKVVQNGEFGSRVKIEGDIPAFIPLRCMSDERAETADDFVQPGQVVTAVVTEVKKDHMTVDLSLRMDDYRKLPSSWERPQSLPILDDSFDTGAARAIEIENNKKREARLEALLASLGTRSDKEGQDAAMKKRFGRVVRRACTHPAFRNSNNKEVDFELREAGVAMVGEALIRPSSKNSDSLAIHWVVREGSIKVEEVVEEDKETEASIGNKLKIRGETYGSIDELLGRYIAPMNDYVEELVNHRKFMDVAEDEVDEKLMQQKKQTPKSIPYAFCWLEEHPGYASLRFVGSVTPRSHPVGITPKGFSWSGNTYSSLDRLINDFKRNPKGTVKNSAPAATAPNPAAISTIPAKPANRGRWGAKPPPPARPPAQVEPHWNPPPQVQAPSIAPVASYGGWNAPPPPPPHPYGHVPPQNYRRPPPAYTQHPPPPPAFDAAVGQGRGRGRTLPAWMSKGS